MTSTLLELRRPVPTFRARAAVFQDPASRALLDQVERVAPSDASILVWGETGTGKEIIARHLHDRSARARAPFVAVNCGAIPPALVESELFGHERGAFTGALTARAGYFEAASGGTLFLDEIGELPAPVQVALLRVLQEREVTRVGARAPIPVDVRVVAATHRDLREAVSEGRFRQDLFFRIAVATLRIPALRERPGDILPLAEHFLQRHSLAVHADAGRLALTPGAEARLLAHPWPGNIRELENVVQHAVLLRRGNVLTEHELVLDAGVPHPKEVAAVAPSRPSDPPRIRRPEANEAVAVTAPDPEEALREALDRMLASGTTDLRRRVDRLLYERAFHASARNQLRTARVLGESRHVVRARLLEHGLLEHGAAKSGSLRTVRIGVQRLGALASAANRRALERALARHEIHAAWVEHGAGIAIAEAMGRGEIDLGVMGEAPPVFAQAAGADVSYLLAEPARPTHQAIVASRRGPVRSVRDLRGRTLAVSRASSSLYLVVRALHEAELGLGEVELSTLAPEAARRAFERDEVDAWAIWDPILDEARRDLGAIVLRDGAGLTPHRTFYLVRSALLGEAPVTVQSIVRALADEVPEIAPIGADVVAEQQEIADTLYRARLVARRVDVIEHTVPGDSLAFQAA